MTLSETNLNLPKPKGYKDQILEFVNISAYLFAVYCMLYQDPELRR